VPVPGYSSDRPLCQLIDLMKDLPQLFNKGQFVVLTFMFQYLGYNSASGVMEGHFTVFIISIPVP
jgi:hypothetical protein